MTPYYEQDGITIYHGDCREVLAALPVGCIATTVTSPPYNTLGSRVSVPRMDGFNAKMAGWKANVRETGYADDMSEPEYLAWQVAIAEGIARVTRPGGSFFYNHKIRYRDCVPIHPIDIVRAFAGWALRQEIVWDRPGSFVFNGRMFAPKDERIYWLVRDGGEYVWNQSAAAWFTVWQMSPPTEIEGHPCPFPIALPNRCIGATTNPGDVVLEPFMGTGQTLIAAKENGCKGIGIERREDYCEIAANRLSQQMLFTQPTLVTIPPVTEDRGATNENEAAERSCDDIEPDTERNFPPAPDSLFA